MHFLVCDTKWTSGMLFPWQFMAPHMHGNGYRGIIMAPPPPPIYGKVSITTRITVRCILVSSLKFQIIIFVYYSNFMLHFILCFGRGIIPSWTDALNRQDCKPNGVKYRFSGLAFRFLCKLVPCSIRVDHTKKLTTFFGTGRFTTVIVESNVQPYISFL